MGARSRDRKMPHEPAVAREDEELPVAAERAVAVEAERRRVDGAVGTNRDPFDIGGAGDCVIGAGAAARGERRYGREVLDLAAIPRLDGGRCKTGKYDPEHGCVTPKPVHDASPNMVKTGSMDYSCMSHRLLHIVKRIPRASRLIDATRRPSSPRGVRGTS